MNRYLKICFLLFGFLITSPSWAILHLVLTQGVDSAIPMAIVPFAQSVPVSGVDVSIIITNDLYNSGHFKASTSDTKKQTPHGVSEMNYVYWQQQGVNYVVIGSVKALANQQYQVSFALIDVYKNQSQPGANPQVVDQTHVLLNENFTVPTSRLRPLTHHISDMIYQKITGDKGVFSTKLAYVSVQHPTPKPSVYKLMISDYDGFNPQPVLISKEPIMSPSWAPDGKQLAYVSFEKRLPAIFISNIVTGKRRLISDFAGINGAPAFAPNGTQLAIVLSKGAQPNIYIANLSTGKLQQVTRDYAITTEPSWSLDAKSLLFTSDRGGSPQVYLINLASGKSQRMTFSGNYNAQASFTPDGNSILLLHRGEDTEGRFAVALQDLATNTIQVLTMVGSAQSPSMAPNGSMIVYTLQQSGQKDELAMVSSDGRVRLTLPSEEGDVREPSWSPYLGN
ncbi:MAG: Tol-Pal system beta propeller repeat protein TolB [Gammaproteobacteria bacterium]|nr:Tol-Pal system beta propeller repeat protein TolB [Gammaproteobacteria bacterium]